MMDSQDDTSDIELTLIESVESVEVADEDTATTEEVKDRSSSTFTAKVDKMQVELEPNTDSLDNDLSSRAHFIEETFEANDFDNIEEFDTSSIKKAAPGQNKISNSIGSLLKTKPNGDVDALVCPKSVSSGQNLCNGGINSNHVDQSSLEENHDSDSTVYDKGSGEESGPDSVATVLNSAGPSPLSCLANGEADEVRISESAPTSPKEETPSLVDSVDIALLRKNNYSDKNDCPRPFSPENNDCDIVNKETAEKCNGVVSQLWKSVESFNSDSRKRKSITLSLVEETDQSEPSEKYPKINSNGTAAEVMRTHAYRKKTTARKTITGPVKSSKLISREPTEPRVLLLEPESLSSRVQEIQSPSEESDAVSVSDGDQTTNAFVNDLTKQAAVPVDDEQKEEKQDHVKKVEVSIDATEEPLGDSERTSIRNGEFREEVFDNSNDVVNDLSKAEGKGSVDSTSVQEDNSIKLGTESLNEENIKNIFLKMKRFSKEQLEEVILHKCCELIAENSRVGEMKKQLADLQQAETYRKHQVCSLEKQIHQLRGVCRVFMERVKELKENHRITSPTIITRSVGLQVAFDSNPYVKIDGNSCPMLNSNAGETKAQTSNRSDKRTQESSSFFSSPKAQPNPASPNSNSKAADLKSSSSFSNSATTEADNRLAPSPNNVYENDTSVGRSSPLNRRMNSPPVTADTAFIDLTLKDDKCDSPCKSDTNNKVNTVERPLPNSQVANIRRNNLQTARSRSLAGSPLQHPAPLPASPIGRTMLGLKKPPPEPELQVYKNNHGISLNWKMDLTVDYALIAKYQIYAYQETALPVSVDLWKSVGDVNALPLPMACTLTQFVNGFTYHFAVRAVDVHGRIGPFSPPKSITL